MRTVPKHPLTILGLLVVCASFLTVVGDKVPADDHGNERDEPMRFETLAHGKTELMSYLVSQPIHDGTYGHDGTCDLAVTMRNIGAKHIDLDKIQVSAFDEDERAIKTIIVNQPQSISIGGLTIWQIRLLPTNDWPKSVVLNFRSHADAFGKFHIATPKFVMLQSPVK